MMERCGYDSVVVLVSGMDFVDGLCWSFDFDVFLLWFEETILMRHMKLYSLVHCDVVLVVFDKLGVDSGSIIEIVISPGWGIGFV